jgi:CDGSH-type Zn-finger protein
MGPLSQAEGGNPALVGVFHTVRVFLLFLLVPLLARLYPRAMRLEFLENGPIRVEGRRFVVRVGEKEEVLERPRVFLCRCGGSANKPFCDGTHKRLGFQAAGGVLEVEEA